MAGELNPITGLPEDNKPKLTGIQKVGSSGAAKSQLSPMHQLLKPVDISESIPEEAPSKRVQLASYKDFTVNPNYNAIMDQYNKNFEFERNKYLKQLDDEQNYLESFGAGVGKFLIKTVAGTGLGLMSTGWGMAKALFTWDADAMVEDNIFSEAEEWAKEGIDKVLPIYSDNPNYHQMSFMDKLMNEPGKLFGDEVGDALAFTASAIGQEILLSAATAASFGAAEPIQAAASVKLAKKGYNLIKNLSKGKKYMKTADVAADAIRMADKLEDAGKIARISNIMKNSGATALGLSVATHYEAAIEARGTKDAMLQKYAEDIYNKYGREATETEMQYAEKLADDAMWATYGMNAAILSASNLIQFSSVFNKGYKGYKGSMKAMEQVTKKGADYVTKHAEKSTLKKLLTYSYLTAKNPVTEAMEEFSQGVAHEGSLEYFGRQYSPEHTKNALGFFGTYGKAAVDYFGSTEGGNSMGIGAIVGLLGLKVPGMKGWQGGVVGEISNYNKNIKAAEGLVAQLNNSDFRSALKENFKNSVVFSSLANDKAIAAANNDIFEFKNLEHDEMFTYMYNRVKLGLKDDVLDDISKLEQMTLEQFNQEFAGEGVEEFTDEKKSKTIEKAKEFVEAIENNTKAVEHIIEHNLRNQKGEKAEDLRKNAEVVKPFLIHAASTLQNADIREKELVDRLGEISNFTPEEVDRLAIISNDYAVLGKLSGLARKEKKEGKLSEEDLKLRNELLTKNSINRQKYKDLLETVEEVNIDDLRSIKGDFIDATVGVDQTAFMKLAKERVEEYAKTNPTRALVNKGEMLNILEDVAKLKNRRESFSKFYDYLATEEGISKMAKLTKAAETAAGEEVQAEEDDKVVKETKKAKTKAQRDKAKQKAQSSMGETANQKHAEESSKKAAEQAKGATPFDPTHPGSVKQSLTQRYKNNPELFEEESDIVAGIFEEMVGVQGLRGSFDTVEDFIKYVQKHWLPGSVDPTVLDAIATFYSNVQQAADTDSKIEQHDPTPDSKPVQTTGVGEQEQMDEYDAFAIEQNPLKANVWEFAYNSGKKVFERLNGVLQKANPLTKYNKVDVDFINKGNLTKGDTVRLVVDTRELQTDISSKTEFINKFKILLVTDKGGQERVVSLLPSYKNQKGAKALALQRTRQDIYDKLVKDGVLDDASFSANRTETVDTGYEASISSVDTGRIHVSGGLNENLSDVLGEDFILGIVRTTTEGIPYLDVPNAKIDFLEPSKDSLNPGNVYAMVKSANGLYVAAHVNTRDLNGEEISTIEPNLLVAGEEFDRVLTETKDRAEAHKASNAVLKELGNVVYTKDISVLEVIKNENGEIEDVHFQLENPYNDNLQIMALEEVEELLSQRKAQVDVTKINTISDGVSYNNSIDGDVITTNLVPGKPIHSATFNLNAPYLKGKGKGGSVNTSNKEEKIEEDPTEENPALELIAELEGNIEFIKGRTKDGEIVDIRDGVEYVEYYNTKTKKAYVRTTNYTSDKQYEDNSRTKSARIIGNKVDKLIRDFFAGDLKELSEYDVAPSKELKKFIMQLQQLKTKFEVNGETVVSKDIVLFDDKTGVAGTVDLLTYDLDGNIRIYDIKTMSNNNFTTYITPANTNEPVISYDFKGTFDADNRVYIADENVDSKREQHQKQLSMYNILMKNTHGKSAVELGVIPVVVNYKPGDTTSTKLQRIPTAEVAILERVDDARLSKGDEVKPVQKKEERKSGRRGYKGNSLHKVKRRKIANGSTRKWDKEKSLKWLKKNLPNVPVHILEDLKTIAETGGKTAWGLFANSSMYIVKNAGAGTAFHEAFHAVFWLSLTDNQRFALLQEAQAATGLTDDIDLEEWIAEKFEEYAMSNVIDASLGTKIKNWFKRIWASIRGVSQHKLTIDQLFDNINNGIYKKTKVTGRHADILRAKLADFSVNDRYERIEMLSSMFVSRLDELESENPEESVPSLINNYEYELIDGKVVSGPQAFFAEMYETNLSYIKDTLQDILDNGLDWDKITQLDYYQDTPELYEKYRGVAEEDIIRMLEQYEMLLEHFNEDGTPSAINLKESLFNEVLKDLRKYGIKINLKRKETEKDSEEQENEDQERQQENKTYESWQFDRAEMSGKETISFYVKYKLSKFVEYKYVEGELEPVEDNLGYQRRMEFARVFNALKLDLTGIYNINDMISTMEELIPSKPYYKQIIDELQSDPRFRSAFLHAMATAQMNYVTAVQDKGKYTVVGSNRNTPELLIRKEWNANFVLSKRQNNINHKELVASRDKISNWLKANKVSIVAEGLQPAQATIISNYLNKLGIGLTPEEVIESRPVIEDFFNKGVNFLLDAIEKDNNPFSMLETGETSSLLPLINVAVKTRNDLYESSFLNVENKQVFSNQVPNFMYKAMQALKRKDKSYIAELQRDPFFANNIWLNEIKNNDNLRDLLEVFVLDGINSKEEDAVKYSKMSDKQRFLTDLVFYYNTQDNKEGEEALYSYPILADAPRLPLIRFKKYSKQEIKENLKKVAIQEWDRNQKIKKALKNYKDGKLRLEDLIENYHYTIKDGKVVLADTSKYQYITTMGSWSPKSPTNAKKTEDAIQEFLDKEVEAIKRMATNFGINKGQVSSTLENFDTFISNYVYNKTFANIQSLQLFSGDSAMYKSQVDLAKRNKQTNAPGSILDTTEIGETYNTLYLKDRIRPSEFLDIYKKVIKNQSPQRQKEILEPYGKVDVADGQGVISLKRAKDILTATGEWTIKHDKAYPKLVKGVATQEEMSLFIQPFKPFYYGFTYNETFDAIISVQNKNSEFVIFPQMLNMPGISKEGKARLQKMLDIFEDGTVDSIQFESAVKVGKSKVWEFADINSDNMGAVRKDAHTLYNKDYNLQLTVPEHHMDTEILLGVQVMKHVIANMDLKDTNASYTLNGEKVTAKELFDQYHSAISENIKEEAVQLQAIFNDNAKLGEILMDEMISRGMSKKYIDALEINEDGNFEFPLYFPISATKNESVMSALYRNRVTRQKIKGGSFVQVSDFIFGEGLKLITKEVDGETIIDSMEALLPWWSKKYFPMDSNGIVDISKIPDNLLELVGFRIPTEAKYSMTTIKVVGFTPQTAGGVAVLPADITRRAGTDFDVDKLFIMMPEFDTIKKDVADPDKLERQYQQFVTTPNWSPKAGMDIVRSEIPGFNPERGRQEFAKAHGYYWNSKKGKFQQTTKEVKKVEPGMETKKSRNNLILDIMKSILQNPKHQDENIKPGSFDRLLALVDPKNAKGIISKLGLGNQAINMALPSSQMELFSRNMAATALIGMFANHAASHSITQYSKISFENPFRFITESGDELSLGDFFLQKDVKGNYIAESIAELLAAAVDNAKDPVLSMLNVNTHTADIVAMLIRGGMSLEDAIHVINVPSIRDLVDEMKNGTDFDIAFGLIQSKLKSEYPSELKNVNDDYVTSNIIDLRRIKGTVMAADKVSPGNKDMYANTLYNSLLLFNSLKQKSEELAMVVTAAKVDSFGSRTLAENQELMNKIQKARESETFVQGTVAELFDGGVYPMLKEFYWKGIEEATDNIGRYIPFQKGKFADVKNAIKLIKKGELKDSEDKLINNHILTYIASKFELFNISREEASDMIIYFPEEFALEVEEDEYLQNNKFIQAIFFEEATGEDGNIYDRLITNNAARLEESQREKIELAFEELIRNPKYENFAKEIMQYGFLANGFSFNPRNFLSAMPVSIFKDIIDSNGNTLMKHFENNINNFNAEEFLQKFIPNTFETHNLVRTVELNNTVDSSGNILSKGLMSRIRDYYTTYSKNDNTGVMTSFTIAEQSDSKKPDNPQFMKIKDGETVRLYHKEYVSNSGYELYTLVPKVSHKNVYVQYTADAGIDYSYLEDTLAPLELFAEIDGAMRKMQNDFYRYKGSEFLRQFSKDSGKQFIHTKEEVDKLEAPKKNKKSVEETKNSTPPTVVTKGTPESNLEEEETQTKKNVQVNNAVEEGTNGNMPTQEELEALNELYRQRGKSSGASIRPSQKSSKKAKIVPKQLNVKPEDIIVDKKLKDMEITRLDGAVIPVRGRRVSIEGHPDVEFFATRNVLEVDDMGNTRRVGTWQVLNIKEGKLKGHAAPTKDESGFKVNPKKLQDLPAYLSRGFSKIDTATFNETLTELGFDIAEPNKVGKQEEAARDNDTQIKDLENLKFTLSEFLIRVRKGNILFFNMKSLSNQNGISKKDLDSEMSKYQYLRLFSTPREIKKVNSKVVETGVNYQWIGRDTDVQGIMEQLDALIEELKENKPPVDPTISKDELDELPGCVK